ncbi:MAG: hypothetical protein R3B68_02385 [Phycisphaerales bacterium]
MNRDSAGGWSLSNFTNWLGVHSSRSAARDGSHRHAASMSIASASNAA